MGRHHWLLLINAVIGTWAVAQIHFAATEGFPEAMSNQSCCRSDGAWLDSGECCPSGTNRFNRDECDGGEDLKIAAYGIRSCVKHYRWIVAIILLIFAGLPYHAIYTLSNDAGEQWNMWSYIFYFAGFVGLLAFLASNVILGYGQTNDCRNPSTNQFDMLAEHSPYDFWMLAIGAYGVLAVVAFVLAIIALGYTANVVVAFVAVCMGYRVEVGYNMGCLVIKHQPGWAEKQRAKKREKEAAARVREEEKRKRAAVIRTAESVARCIQEQRAWPAEIRVVVEHAPLPTPSAPPATAAAQPQPSTTAPPPPSTAGLEWQPESQLYPWHELPAEPASSV